MKITKNHDYDSQPTTLKKQAKSMMMLMRNMRTMASQLWSLG